MQIGRVDFLAERLKSKAFDDVQKAAEELAEIGGEKAVRYLADALNSEDFRVRMTAAEALGNSGEQIAVQPLIEAFKKESQAPAKGRWIVLTAIVYSLSNIGETNNSLREIQDYVFEKLTKTETGRKKLELINLFCEIIKKRNEGLVRIAKDLKKPKIRKRRRRRRLWRTLPGPRMWRT